MQRSTELLGEKLPWVLEIEARAHHALGQLAKAIQVQKKVVKLYEKDTETPPFLVEAARETLAVYEEERG